MIRGNSFDEAPDADERQRLAAQDRQDRRYQAAFRAHPDPRDPEFPGYLGEEA